MSVEPLAHHPTAEIRARKAMMRIGLSILSATLSTVGAAGPLRRHGHKGPITATAPNNC
jgi:hypothetical protein